MKIKARMIVELDVYVESAWGDNCSLSQVRKQAREMAMVELNKLFMERPIDSGIHLRSNPKPVILTFEESK